MSKSVPVCGGQNHAWQHMPTQQKETKSGPFLARYGGRKAKQDKGVLSPEAARRSHLPAVRADTGVFSCYLFRGTQSVCAICVPANAVFSSTCGISTKEYGGFMGKTEDERKLIQFRAKPDSVRLPRLFFRLAFPD